MGHRDSSIGGKSVQYHPEIISHGYDTATTLNGQPYSIDASLQIIRKGIKILFMVVLLIDLFLSFCFFAQEINLLNRAVFNSAKVIFPKKG